MQIVYHKLENNSPGQPLFFQILLGVMKHGTTK